MENKMTNAEYDLLIRDLRRDWGYMDEALAADTALSLIQDDRNIGKYLESRGVTDLVGRLANDLM